MNRALDDMRYRIFCITVKSSTPYLMKWAADALAYYVNTGRASADWIRAYCKANPKKLLTYMAKGDDHSTMAMLDRAHYYLKRYCKLDA